MFLLGLSPFLERCRAFCSIGAFGAGGGHDQGSRLAHEGWGHGEKWRCEGRGQVEMARHLKQE